MHESRSYQRETEITVLQLSEMAEKRQEVIVQTDFSSCIYPAFELLDWHLKSLLKVKLFKTTKTPQI